MPRTVVTTTISLPKSVCARIRSISRSEHRTMSALIRDAWQMYEQSCYAQKMDASTWHKLSVALKRVSKAGKSIGLSEFVSHDRSLH